MWNSPLGVDGVDGMRYLTEDINNEMYRDINEVRHQIEPKKRTPPPRCRKREITLRVACHFNVSLEAASATNNVVTISWIAV